MWQPGRASKMGGWKQEWTRWWFVWIQRVRRSHVLDQDNADLEWSRSVEEWLLIRILFGQIILMMRSRPIRDLVYTMIVLPWSWKSKDTKGLKSHGNHLNKKTSEKSSHMGYHLNKNHLKNPPVHLITYIDLLWNNFEVLSCSPSTLQCKDKKTRDSHIQLPMPN